MAPQSGFLEQIRTVITPGLVSQISSSLGMEQETVKKGSEVVIPLLSMALARKVSATAGASEVYTLAARSDVSLLSDLGGYVERFSPGAGEADLGQILGGGQSAVFASIRQALGIDLKPLAELLALIMVALIGAVARARRLDAAGLAKLLRSEARRVAGSGSPAGAIIVQALKAGEDQVAIKGKFTAEEWAALKAGVTAAAALVIVAAPSGFMGTGREIRALWESVAATMAASPARGLVRALYGEGTAEEVRAALEELVRSLKASAETAQQAEMLYIIAAAARSAEKAGPSEGLAYRAMLSATAQAVARAAREDGFLGVGGVLINDAERQVLAEIAAALLI